MKPSSNTHSAAFASASTGARRMPRPFWGIAPIAHAAPANDLDHETEVMRGLTLAIPLSLALWVPLIAAGIYLF